MACPELQKPRRMLEMVQVLRMVPVSRSTLLRMVRERKFPQSVYVSPNRRVWFEDEITPWLEAMKDVQPWRGIGKRLRERATS